LEEFVALCDRDGVSQVATVTADIDLGNDDGLFMACVFAAFAAKESGRKSARIRRKMLQNAEQGLPHGSVRPFGYEDDKITLRPDEVVVVREMVDRHLAGQSIKSLTVWPTRGATLCTTGTPTPCERSANMPAPTATPSRCSTADTTFAYGSKPTTDRTQPNGQVCYRR